MDNTRFQEAKERLVDEVVLIGVGQIKGYTSKHNLKAQFEKLNDMTARRS